MTVQFICRGNAFRSIVAEAYLRSLDIPGLVVVSSGTIAGRDKAKNYDNFLRTLALLKKHGIAQYAKDHYADGISQTLLDKSDIVICLNKIVYAEALNLCTLPEKTYIWHVADLGEVGRIASTHAEREAYAEDIYTEIVKNVDALASSIRSVIDPS